MFHEELIQAAQLTTQNGSNGTADRRGSNGTANGAAAVKARRRTEDSWLERWMASTADLARLQYSHRMVDAVIDQIKGREIRIGSKWLTDYASCNYLGFDLDDTMDPQVTNFDSTIRVTLNICEPLVWEPEPGKFVPGLADSWEISPDRGPTCPLFTGNSGDTRERDAPNGLAPLWQ